jgi:glycosyltransferase involved in cell wall biosynthesis
MKSLALFRAQRRYRSGDDAFSQAFANAMTPYFSPVTLSEITPQWHEDLLESFPVSLLPFRHGMYNRSVRPMMIRDAVRRLTPHGVVCVRDELWRGDATALFEREIAERNTYLYNLFDNWFAVPHLAERVKVRCELANAIIVPTVRLKEICEESYPRKPVFAIEEPVDCSRFDATAVEKSDVPTLVWAGSPYSQSELVAMRDILAAVHRLRPFDLVVLSGDRKPALSLPIPWRWVSFSPANEQEFIPRAWAGFCRLETDDYASAKGCYKTKVYMAAGTVPVVTDIGHARQVVNAAGAGVLIRDNDARLWIDTLVQMLTSRDTAILEGGRARAFACEQFAYDSIAADWARAIQKVC